MTVYCLFTKIHAEGLTCCYAQVAVHGLVGTTVRLMDEVPGSLGITWGMLYEEGLFNPLFAVRFLVSTLSRM